MVLNYSEGSPLPRLVHHEFVRHTLCCKDDLVIETRFLVGQLAIQLRLRAGKVSVDRALQLGEFFVDAGSRDGDLKSDSE